MSTEVYLTDTDISVVGNGLELLFTTTDIEVIDDRGQETPVPDLPEAPEPPVVPDVPEPPVAETPEETDLVFLPEPHYEHLDRRMEYTHSPLSHFAATTVKKFFRYRGETLDTVGDEKREFAIGDDGISFSVSTERVGHRFRPVPSTSQRYASIVLVDEDGLIVDWCYLAGSSSITAPHMGAYVIVPADGKTYYLQLQSDTGKMKLQHWGG